VRPSPGSALPSTPCPCGAQATPLALALAHASSAQPPADLLLLLCCYTQGYALVMLSWPGPCSSSAGPACPALPGPPRSSPQRPAPRYSSDRPRPSLPLARLSSVLSAPDPNTDTGEVPLTPLILICPVGTRHQKLRLYRFVFRQDAGGRHPPAIFSPKIFKPKIRPGPWRRRGGWGMVPADPWPRGKVTPAPLTLGCPLPWPW
jgi:hypothetical protein